MNLKADQPRTVNAQCEAQFENDNAISIDQGCGLSNYDSVRYCPDQDALIVNLALQCQNGAGQQVVRRAGGLKEDQLIEDRALT